MHTLLIDIYLFIIGAHHTYSTSIPPTDHTVSCFYDKNQIICKNEDGTQKLDNTSVV